MNQRDGDAGTGASDGMAERDRSSVDIELVAIEMKFAVASQHLGGECFVEFDEIEVSEFEAVLCFELSDCWDGADAH